MCKHPNVKLLISWTVDMTTEGPEVLVSRGPECEPESGRGEVS